MIVGLGIQNKRRLYKGLGMSISLGIGVSFDFEDRNIKRTPKWMTYCDLK